MVFPIIQHDQNSQIPFKETVAGQGEVIWRQLVESASVRQQQAAFTCATGLPLTLMPAHATNGTLRAGCSGSLFCVKGCMGERGGELCQRTLNGAEQRAGKTFRPVQFRCPAGLIKILVPVVIGGHHAGNLLVGPFSLKKLNVGRFHHLARRLKEWGLGTQLNGLRASWRYSPVITTERGRAVATMLNMFAQYLSECGHRFLLEEANQHSPLLRKIEAFLAEQRLNPISLKELAKRVHLSPCYFCKLFKKQTGLTFTEYHARARIEKAKQLLLNQHFRVSEAAFEAGFDSIPYFNRVFRRHTGCSPSQYRLQGARMMEDKKATIQA